MRILASQLPLTFSELVMRMLRTLSALLLAVYMPACSSFHATTQPLAELTAPPKPAQHLRVTREGGEQVYLDAPQVITDSLRGFDARSLGEEVAIPVADIRQVEVQEPSAGKTLGMFGIVVGALALLVGTAFVVACC